MVTDYAIIAVKFNRERTHMTAFSVCTNTSLGLGDPKMWTFKDVAQAILDGKTFMTAVRTKDGNFNPGALVELHLRSRSDERKADNLALLPPF